MSRQKEIDQQTAKRLLLEGGTLVFLGVPEGTEFGIDLKSWKVGQKFRGVKMIPPGMHFIYVNAINKHLDTAPRIGFMHNFKKSEVVLKRWNPETEDLVDEVVSEEEIERFKSNLLNLDKFLGVYPYDIWKKWTELTNRLTEDLVARLVPECGKIRSALEFTATDRPRVQRRSLSRYTTQEEKDELLLPNLQPKPGTEQRFTPFPDKHYPDGSTPSEITKHSLDRTYTLETMLATCSSAVELIGEVQFSFMCFLVGLSLESFEHWKQLVALLCSCEVAVKRRSMMYIQFLEALESQLAVIPEDFLVDIVSSNNVIYCSLRDLFRVIHSSDLIEGRLQSRAERLQEKLTGKFLWDFSELNEEDEDDAPVIVEM